MSLGKVLFTLCLTWLTFQLSAQESWELKKNKNGIQIYTRSVSNSSFKEFKATTVLETSIADVLSELINAPSYREHCEPGISFKVTSLDKNQHVFYARKELPWPIKNRDIVTLLTVDKISENKIKLKLESLPNGLPEKDKTIRIKELMGFWLLEEKHGKTHITQQLFLNPEGSLPPMITNSLLIKGPYKTFSELRRKTTGR